jgi:hypothetical protein
MDRTAATTAPPVDGGADRSASQAQASNTVLQLLNRQIGMLQGHRANATNLSECARQNSASCSFWN